MTDTDDDTTDRPRATTVTYLWEDGGFQHAPGDGEYTWFAGDVSCSIENDLTNVNRTTRPIDPTDLDRTFSASITLGAHSTAMLLGWLEDGAVCAVCGRPCDDGRALETHVQDQHGLQP